MMKNKIAIVVLLLGSAISFQLCKNASKSMKEHSPFVDVSGQHFIDPQGNALTLHGINVVNKDPKTGYLGHVTAEDFQMFKSWGFNAVRLGIIWDGIEPQPGQYNETYLKGVDQMIQWAADNNIYVFLDMHQDLYGVEFSDGAPKWATLTEGQPHQTGAIWSDAYLMSPAVQTAFDNFWRNKSASDSVGIRDHYVNMWKMLAERYANNTTVIGYDLMNEPFMGSGAQQVMPKLVEAYAHILAETTGQAPPPVEELMYMWSAERLKVLKTLEKREVYQQLIDGIYDINAGFESGVLAEFYQQCRDAIREVDANHIIFIEHSYFTNMGVRGALVPILDEQGEQDARVAYAAHGYDLVVDTDALTLGSNERVTLIFDRIAETGARLNVPVLIGEWGALYGSSPELIPVAQNLMGEFNRHGFSDTFWAYGEFLKNASFLEVLKKPYAASVSGVPEKFNYDVQQGNFEFQWQENASCKEPTRIFVPHLDKVDKESMELTPAAGHIDVEPMEGTDAGFLMIPTSGKDIKKAFKFHVVTSQTEEISLNN